jgi:hypothetical protein
MAINVSGIGTLIAKAGQTCDIKKPIQSVDDIGQTIRSFVIHKSGLVCWQQEKSSNSIDGDGKVFLDNRVFFYFSSNPEIVEGYVIVFKGQNYIVEGINDQGGVGQLFRVDVGYKK